MYINCWQVMQFAIGMSISMHVMQQFDTVRLLRVEARQFLLPALLMFAFRRTDIDSQNIQHSQFLQFAALV